MDFEQIKQEVKGVQIETLRLENENNFEAVIPKAQIVQLTAVLESFFGPAIFPSKNKLPEQIAQEIDEYGGIMPGQTLYYRNDAGSTVFAMLWPWGDGMRTTLKIINK